ncbi:MAG: GNAT family N-acetyltransferase [bacterium]
MEQQKILDPIPSHILEAELKNARFVKETEHGGNHIYVFSGKDCPYLMMQIGILREMSFRQGGGGTGNAIDIDRWDEFAHPDFPGPYATNGFKQLIVWDPDNKEIIGGYRYAKMENFISKDHTSIDSPTIELFNCSLNFIRMYAPFAIELGRSFVQPKYQWRADYAPPRKAMYALDNLFDGLGTLVVDFKDQDIQYFFGKVTMYKTYNRQARNMILYYMEKHFPDTHTLVTPKSELIPPGLKDEIDLLESIFVGNTEREDKQILIKSLREVKEGMPPLFNKYTEMSPTMKVFGTAINHHCGEVEETAIMIRIADIVEKYKKNYIRNYFQKKFKQYFH